MSCVRCISVEQKRNKIVSLLQLFFEMLLTVTFEAIVLVMYWNLKANEHPKLFGLR